MPSSTGMPCPPRSDLLAMFANMAWSAAPAWARAMIEFSDFLLPVDAKTFDLEEEGAPWAWIEAAPEV